MSYCLAEHVIFLAFFFSFHRSFSALLFIRLRSLECYIKACVTIQKLFLICDDGFDKLWHNPFVLYVQSSVWSVLFIPWFNSSHIEVAEQEKDGDGNAGNTSKNPAPAPESKTDVPEAATNAGEPDGEPDRSDSDESDDSIWSKASSWYLFPFKLVDEVEMCITGMKDVPKRTGWKHNLIFMLIKC